MLILGIETSCDETAAAVIRDGTTIVSHVKATSFDINKKYGGVVPDKTAREQLQFILPIIHEALAACPDGIDAIGVTYGPGLIGSLLIGVETAKALALALNKPLVPINHLVGHIYGNWLTATETKLTFDLPTNPPSFPALVLIVSGGHSELILMSDHGKFKLLGSTLDDAAGECFDKCGRVIDLPYPYGPYIETAAAKSTGKIKLTLPRPLIHHRNWDFSFSGLKTAFLYAFKDAQVKGIATEDFKAALAFELQEAVTDILVSKFSRAAKEFNISSLIVAGGVAANNRLREKLRSTLNSELPTTKLFIPPLQLCTDNAVYIASAAFFNYHPQSIAKITADPGLNF